MIIYEITKSATVFMFDNTDYIVNIVDNKAIFFKNRQDLNNNIKRSYQILDTQEFISKLSIETRQEIITKIFK